MSLSQTLALAESAHQQGQLEKAEELYQQILATNKNTDALFGLATLYHQKNDYLQAQPLFEQALIDEPNAFDIAYNYLLATLSANQRATAIKLLPVCIKNCPSDPTLQTQLANVALQLNAFEQAIIVAPNIPAGKNIKCQAYMKLEQWLPAYTEAKALVKQFPEEEVPLNNLSICAAKLDKFDEAIEVFSKLIDNHKNESAKHLRFADLYLMAKQVNNARSQLDIAISLKDTSLMRYDIECKVCRLENNKSDALVAADKAISIKPEADFAWQVKHDLGNEDDNKQCIKQLSQLTADDSQYSYDLQHNLYTLAKAFQKEALYQEAFTTFGKANQLQSRQFKQDDNTYDRACDERIFARIKKLNYAALPNDSKPTQHYFVVGMPRSGTTLVNRVLSQLPTIDSCGESNAVATLFENRLYNENLSDEMITNWLQENSTEHQAFYRKFNKIPSHGIVDKMPHNFRYVGAILATFPNAKIIQMRRSPIDLALSIYSQFFNRQHSYACNLTDIAHAIVEANKLMDYWSDLYPEQVIDVHYEDLATNPSGGFETLFNYLGLTWQDEYLEFHKQNVASFTFSETQVRKPINRSKIGFSKHYQKQLTPFIQAYEKLSRKL